MALAAPTNLKVEWIKDDLREQVEASGLGGSGTLTSANSNPLAIGAKGWTRGMGKEGFLTGVSARISWQNNETGNHYIVAVVNGSPATLEQGVSHIDIDGDFGYFTTVRRSFSTTVTVQAKSAGDESAIASLTVTVDSARVQNAPSPRYVNGEILQLALAAPDTGLAPWRGQGTITLSPLGHASYMPAVNFSDTDKARLPAIPSAAGKFYTATITNRLPYSYGPPVTTITYEKVPGPPAWDEFLGRFITTEITRAVSTTTVAASRRDLARQVTFEYAPYNEPPAIPEITSALALAALAGQQISYKFTAARSSTLAVSLGESGLAWDAATQTISGTLGAGTYNIGLSATNVAGTATATLVITIAAVPHAALTSPTAVNAVLSRAFRYTLAATNAVDVSVAFGAVTTLGFTPAASPPAYGPATLGEITGAFPGTGTHNIAIALVSHDGTVVNAALAVTVSDAFAATTKSVTLARNIYARIPLAATHRCTWAIASGAPAGFGIENVPATWASGVGPDESFLVGTPTGTGFAEVALTATRTSDSTTASASLKLTIIDAFPVTTISANADLIRNGIAVEAGGAVDVAMSSFPSPATWTAVGLPPGVTMNHDGTITGSPSRTGTFYAVITAQAEGYSQSVAVGIKFSVASSADGPEPVTSGPTAGARSPWLLQQWEITDLHILARTREVQSTAFEGGALRFKPGDSVTLGVFFVDAANAVFEMAPASLKLTVRRGGNLDDALVFLSQAPPSAATYAGQTYYLLDMQAGDDARETAADWVQKSGKNDPLPCLADVEWTLEGGKTYSSRTFPVLVDLDVTRTE